MGMREFVVVGNRAVTESFSLNDLPGAGRMDILCRCINSAFFLSHDIRRDTRIYLVMLGSPKPSLIVRFEGSELKYLNPDERSAGSLISKAVGQKGVDDFEISSTPGVWVRRGGLEDVLSEKNNIIYLREDGKYIKELEMSNNCNDSIVFVLGDHEGMKFEDKELLDEYGATRVSVSPYSLHADHCIIIVQNELDRRESCK